MADVEVLRDEGDKEQFDASVVLGKKEGKYYRWARNDPRNLVMRRLDGYTVCTDPDVKSALGTSTRIKKGEDVDDTITFGDAILMETSVENHERLMEFERRKIVRRTKGVMNTLKQKIREAGGETIEEHGTAGTPKEGRGYDKGYTEKMLQEELGSDPTVKPSSWRRN